MRAILILLGFIGIAHPTPADAGIDLTVCARIEQNARAVMVARQRGYPPSSITADPDLIHRAFNKPVMRGAALKQAAVDLFGQQMHWLCLSPGSAHRYDPYPRRHRHRH